MTTQKVLTDAQLLVRRRMIRLIPMFLLLALLGPGNYLYGCWNSSVGIQNVDIVIAVLMYPFILVVMYWGYRKALSNARSASTSADARDDSTPSTPDQ
jgi:hypothetical protein